MSTTPAKSTSSAKTVTKTTKVVNNRTGVTTSTSVTKTGNSTTITKTKTIGSPKSVSSVKAAAPQLADGWICEPNDRYPVCGPVALANSLLAVTGVRASTADIERLYAAAGGYGDSGVTLRAALAAAMTTPLAGCRIAWYTAAAEDDWFAPGRVLGLELDVTPDAHAAATDAGGALILWGQSFPADDVAGRVDEAWALAWKA